VDDEVGAFTVTVSVHGEGDFYSTDDADRAYAAALERKIPADQQLTTNKVNSEVQVMATGAGHLEFKGRVNGFVAPRIDLETETRRLAGKSGGQARAELAKLPIRSADITEAPFPLPTMPLLSSRIHLEYVVAQGSPAPRPA
jgi:hypothetical protein